MFKEQFVKKNIVNYIQDRGPKIKSNSIDHSQIHFQSKISLKKDEKSRLLI